MSSTEQKSRLAGAFAALAAVVITVSCTGFFPKPTLSSITVDPPTPSVTIGATQQMSATGVFNDNSSNTLAGGTSCSGNTVCWSSSDSTIASITTGGLLTGVATGSTTVTATSGAVSGSTTASVVLGNVTGLTINPTSATITVNSTKTFTAFATISNGSPVDVSSTASWTTGTPTTASVVGGDPATVTALAAGSTTVTATYTTSTTIFTATANIIVP